jgi:hypothetical protein
MAGDRRRADDGQMIPARNEKLWGQSLLRDPTKVHEVIYLADWGPRLH